MLELADYEFRIHAKAHARCSESESSLQSGDSGLVLCLVVGSTTDSLRHSVDFAAARIKYCSAD
jgi:hypothetical protein